MTKYKPTIEYFQKIAEDRDGKCLSTEYSGRKVKLEFECKNGHRWFAFPYSKLKNITWCPKCAFQQFRKYDVDHDFFSRDNEEAFYVAGFWAADGCKTRKGHMGYSINLKLATKDVDHLEKIKKVLKCTGPTKFYETFRDTIVNTKVNRVLYSCKFRFCSEKCYNDLERFGVFERKTYYMRFPEWLQEHPLVHHFMRGYIDGDGSFMISGRNITFSMKGTKEFLNSFHDVLLKNGVCDPNIERREMEARDGSKFAAFDELCYGGNGILSRMYDFLYKDATIFLERKEKIIKKSKDIIYENAKYKKDNIKPIFLASPEQILEKAKELKSTKKVVEFFKCSYNDISITIRKLGIKEKYRSFLFLDPDLIFEVYKKLGTYQKTADCLGIAKRTVYVNMKKIKARNNTV